ncbi:uncharacterized protein BDW47DRAFT_55188 [Aspergillus candidus]|uniref:Uncharacterized protein n=1 Tax=Aspergillus candidus TaxID=41067 RepID=A0A2I2FLF3_ASPCN|nr:hypothetical protein BDW47DRAFT_55188 [Aspergillus candidus]PLB41443.1 hypothetical protein BDW47DRAFT_55188 [Aspergillus candidus]
MHMGVRRELKPRGMTPGCWFPVYRMAITASIGVTFISSSCRLLATSFSVLPTKVSLPRATTTSKLALASLHRVPFCEALPSIIVMSRLEMIPISRMRSLRRLDKPRPASQPCRSLSRWHSRGRSNDRLSCKVM